MMAEFVLNITGTEQDVQEWLNRFNDLNSETQDYLTGVSNDLNGLAENSSGDLVDQMTKAGADLGRNVGTLVESFSTFVQSIGSVFNALAQAVETGLSLVKSIGGLFGLV